MPGLFGLGRETHREIAEFRQVAGRRFERMPDALVRLYRRKAYTLVDAERPTLAGAQRVLRVVAPFYVIGLLLSCGSLGSSTGWIALAGLGLVAVAEWRVTAVRNRFAGQKAVALLETWRDHGGRARVCLRCGYDLRGTPGELCSECGGGRAFIPAGDDHAPGPARRRKLIRGHAQDRARNTPFYKARLLTLAALLGGAGLVGMVVLDQMNVRADWPHVAVPVTGLALAAVVPTTLGWWLTRRWARRIEAAAYTSDGETICWRCGSDRPPTGRCPHCDAAAGEAAPESR